MAIFEHIEDFLVTVRKGQWFSWSDSSNKIYANLIVLDGGTKPTQQECIDGLAKLKKDDEDNTLKIQSDKNSGNTKLKALGLTDDEIKALLGV
tara:strand:+ start:264 stop:542 length:279 start_codon:yes stop_codon:yes gene_type:complete